MSEQAPLLGQGMWFQPGPATLVVRQAGWAILLWPLAGWLWRANREKVTIYGG